MFGLILAQLPNSPTRVFQVGKVVCLSLPVRPTLGLLKPRGVQERDSSLLGHPATPFSGSQALALCLLPRLRVSPDSGLRSQSFLDWGSGDHITGAYRGIPNFWKPAKTRVAFGFARKLVGRNYFCHHMEVSRNYSCRIRNKSPHHPSLSPYIAHTTPKLKGPPTLRRPPGNAFKQ